MMVENLRLMIQTPPTEDNAGAAYQQVAESRVKKSILDQFERLGEGEAALTPKKAAPAGGSGNPDFDALGGAVDEANPAAVTEGAPQAEAKPAPTAEEIETNKQGMGQQILDWHLAVGKDLIGGAVEAPGQVLGGVVDAFGEMDQFMQDVVPIGGAQLFDKDGNFDPSLLTAEEMDASEEAENTLFDMIAPDEADTTTGGFVRATAQFLTGFIPGMQATRGLGALKAGAVLQPLAAGALADMVVFDPNEDRLSTFLNQIPALSSVVPDYLADNNPDQSHWEGRLKNAIEGAGLGLATDGLLSAFKYYKAHRKAKAANKAETDPIGATVEAAKDELKKAAREEMVQDIPDSAFLPLGDVADDAPLLVEAPANETAKDAFTRLSASRERALQHDKDSAALQAINSARDRIAAAKGITDRDPMDDMLDELRSGAVSNAKIPKRPVTAIVKGLGGVDPTSSLAADMRSRGITARKFPGLYRKGGVGALDNVPASEHAIFAGRSMNDPNGYLDQQAFIDGLEAELKGEPWMTAENQKAFDDLISPLDDLEMTLDQMGIDYRTMSNDRIKERIKEIEDAEAIFSRDMGEDALFQSPRTLKDIEAEARAEAEAKGLDPDLAAADAVKPKIYINHARMNTAEDVRAALQIMADTDAGAIAAKQGQLPDVVVKDKGDGITVLSSKDGAGDLSFEVRGNDLKIGIASVSAARRGEGIAVGLYEQAARMAGERGGALKSDWAVSADAMRVYDALKRRGYKVDVHPEAIRGKSGITSPPGTSVYTVTPKSLADLARVTNKETIKQSSKEYRELNDLIGRAPGPMNAAQATAARRLLASSGEQIVQLAKIAESPNASPADIFNFRRAMAVHYAIQSEVVAARTETARALQAWSIPVGATKARSQAIADLIAQQGGSGDIQKIARAISNAEGNPVAVNAMSRQLGRAKIGDALYQVWINSILSGPKSHMANILGNLGTTLWAVPERFMAAGFSKAFYEGEIETGEAVAQAFGLVRGIRDGFRLVAADSARGVSNAAGNLPWDAARNFGPVKGLKDMAGRAGNALASPEDPGLGVFVQVDNVHQSAISADALGLDPSGSFGWGIDYLGKLINIPGGMLNTEDRFFKAINYRMELNALAYRTAAAEGLEGEDFGKRVAEILLDPPETLKADATEYTAYQTLSNPLSGAARQALGGIAKTKYVGPVFKLVMPFVKVTANVMKYGFARTPLAYLAGSIQADIKAGGARAAQAHARIALGSMVMLSIIDMQSAGYITGAGPVGENKAEQANLRRTTRGVGGEPPYSVKLGGRWYAYNRLDPLAMNIGLAASIGEILVDSEEADGEMIVTAGVIALAQNLASKQYLSGMMDFMSALDPESPTGDISKYVFDTAQGLMPYSSFSRSLAYANDPILRETKTQVYGEDLKIDPVATFLQNRIDNLRAQIPGYSEELPARRDLFGEPMSRASGLGWGWDFISPIASKADNPDPVTKEIVDNRISISFPPRVIEGVKLTSEEYDQFTEIAGKQTKELLSDLLANPGFSKLSAGPDGMKAEMIKARINSARDYARALMMAKNPALRDRAMETKRETMRSLTGQ